MYSRFFGLYLFITAIWKSLLFAYRRVYTHAYIHVNTLTLCRGIPGNCILTNLQDMDIKFHWLAYASVLRHCEPSKLLQNSQSSSRATGSEQSEKRQQWQEKYHSNERRNLAIMSGKHYSIIWMCFINPVSQRYELISKFMKTKYEKQLFFSISCPDSFLCLLSFFSSVDEQNCSLRLTKCYTKSFSYCMDI